MSSLSLIVKPLFHLERVVIAAKRQSGYAPFPGRITMNEFTVHDPDCELELGQQVKRIKIDEYTIFGLLPIAHDIEGNNYICTCDNFIKG